MAKGKTAVEIFFQGSLAERAASGMSDSVEINLYIDGEAHIFSRSGGKNLLKKGTAEQAQVVFWVAKDAMQKIIDHSESNDASIAGLGILIFDAILSKDEHNKIKFKVQDSFFGLWTKGYFSVLKVGGPEVAAYLGKVGLSSISQIKDFWKKMKD